MDTWEETTGQPSRPNAAWEASSEQDEKRLRSSRLSAEIADLEGQIAPPSTEAVMAELSRCLRLTVPVGMTADDRREWLIVALPEVEKIPACEFFDACAHARKIADHPAKIVPSIHSYKPRPYTGVAAVRLGLSHKRGLLANLNNERLTDERKSYEPDEALRKGMADLIAELSQAADRAPQQSRKDER